MPDGDKARDGDTARCDLSHDLFLSLPLSCLRVTCRAFYSRLAELQGLAARLSRLSRPAPAPARPGFGKKKG